MPKHKENDQCTNCSNTSANYSVLCGPCDDARTDFETTLSAIYELENVSNELKIVLHRLLHHVSGRKQ